MLDNLLKIIKSEFIESVRGELNLQEQKANIKIKKKGRLLNFKTDQSQIPGQCDFFPYFNNTKGLKKINDNILFYERNGILYIFIIELKSDKDKGALQQIEAGYVFSKFIVESFKRVYKTNLETKFIGLIFSSRGIKPTTKNKIRFKEHRYLENKLYFATLYNKTIYNVDWFINTLQ